MREIKFRAWNSIDKAYVDWCLIKFSFDVFLKSKHYELEQFTGLKDKNGTEIYESDIVKFKSRMDSAIGSVEYSEEETRFVFNIGTKDNPDYRDVGHGWYGTEIIGNIHGNKELLK